MHCFPFKNGNGNCIHFYNSFCMELKHSNYLQELAHLDADIFNILVTGAIGLTILFVYCNSEKRASESFVKMADCLYDVNWYELPPSTQKCFIIMIRSAQKPLFYHGFGILILDLETMTKVRLRTSGSFGKLAIFLAFYCFCVSFCDNASSSRQYSLGLWCSTRSHPIDHHILKPSFHFHSLFA